MSKTKARKKLMWRNKHDDKRQEKRLEKQKMSECQKFKVGDRVRFHYSEKIPHYQKLSLLDGTIGEVTHSAVVQGLYCVKFDERSISWCREDSLEKIVREKHEPTFIAGTRVKFTYHQGESPRHMKKFDSSFGIVVRDSTTSHLGQCCVKFNNYRTAWCATASLSPVFTKGDRVMFHWLEEHKPYAFTSRFDGVIGTIIQPVNATGWVYVRFENGYCAWCPRECLSPQGEPILASKELRFLCEDQFGQLLKVETNQRPGLPGWFTQITHRAYGNGQVITVGCCVTAERARKMHEEWVTLLQYGPLPETVLEIGIGSVEQTIGQTNGSQCDFPRSDWYRSIPLMS